MTKKMIGIIVGSASDLPVAAKAASVLEDFGVGFEIGIASAHRTPVDAASYAANAQSRGLKVIIALAGLSAALPGVLAAHTTLPVIGVPVASGALNGTDALLSVAQMPPGVPVASMGIDGAKNAALLALRIIALEDRYLTLALREWSDNAAADVRRSRSKIAETDTGKFPAAPDSAYMPPDNG